jgi:hypothetical protein
MTMYVRVVAPISITISDTNQDENEGLVLDKSAAYYELPLWAAQHSGFARLWQSGKVQVATDIAFQNLITEIPASEYGGVVPDNVMQFLGTWNASTNTPALANGVGNVGDVYAVSVAGARNFSNSLSPGSYVGPYDNGVDYSPGQIVSYNGNLYTRIGEPNPGYPPGTGYWGSALVGVLAFNVGEHVVYNGSVWGKL